MVEENHNKFTRMITTYSIDYRTQLCEFFSRIIESHKAYISHGELQMGIALDSNELAPNYKEMWLNYLDRQEKTRTTHSCLFGKRNNYRIRIVRHHE